MLIKRLKISRLLSFGLKGIDIELKNLNVLIGPNGSGKSNLIEVLALLKAAPTQLALPIKSGGGIEEWLWKAPQKGGIRLINRHASFRADIVHVGTHGLMFEHTIQIGMHASRFEVEKEEVSWAKSATNASRIIYKFEGDSAYLRENDPEGNRKGAMHKIPRKDIQPEESVLSQFRDPLRYPYLNYIQVYYAQIAIFRKWSMGPDSEPRQGSKIDERDDFLTDGGGNLANSIARISMDSEAKREFLEALREIYSGIVDVQALPQGGQMQVFVTEEGGRQIPASRLSDGTLRYLCLLAVLLHPKPPKLIVIEEPEIGLHPDVILHLARQLVRTSEKTQLVVTTHSRMLIDAMGDEPARIIVCDKENGETYLKRLSKKALSVWLEKYSLGELWSMGKIGGNRW